jgi:tRNA(Ile2) C34 agmatinyltransferase TiaS
MEMKEMIPTLIPRRENDEAVVLCPYCGREHLHSWGSGHRVSHCGSDFPDNPGYYLDCGEDEG